MASWEVVTWDEWHHVHIVPVGDVVAHSEDEEGDCVCGPTVEVMQGDDGLGWLIVHHSLDGREFREPVS